MLPNQEVIHKINPVLAGAVTMRKSLELAIMMIAISCVMFVFPMLWIAGFAAGLHIFPFVLGISVFLFLFFLMSTSNQTTAYRLAVTPHQIIQYKDQGDLNFMNKMGAAKLERTGQRMTQFIKYNDISSVKIGKNGLKIKSKDYDFMNGNGKIDVPKELEDYAKLIKHLKAVVPRSRFMS